MRAAFTRSGLRVPFERVRIGEAFYWGERYWLKVGRLSSVEIGQPDVTLFTPAEVELAAPEVLPDVPAEAVEAAAIAAGFEVGAWTWRMPLGSSLPDLLRRFAELVKMG